MTPACPFLHFGTTIARTIHPFQVCCIDTRSYLRTPLVLFGINFGGPFANPAIRFITLVWGAGSVSACLGLMLAKSHTNYPKQKGSNTATYRSPGYASIVMPIRTLSVTTFALSGRETNTPMEWRPLIIMPWVIGISPACRCATLRLH